MDILRIYEALNDIKDAIGCDYIEVSVGKKKFEITAYKKIGKEFCKYAHSYGANKGLLLTPVKTFIQKSKQRFDGVYDGKDKTSDNN